MKKATALYQSNNTLTTAQYAEKTAIAKDQTRGIASKGTAPG